MRPTIDEINKQIAELIQQKYKLGAVTVDGVDIEVGMTVYALGLGTIERYEVTKETEFQELGIKFSGWGWEEYSDLYADLDKAKAGALVRAFQELENAERRLENAKVRFKLIEEGIEESIKSWDCTHENYEVLDTTAIITVTHKVKCKDCGKIFQIDEGY